MDRTFINSPPPSVWGQVMVSQQRSVPQTPPFSPPLRYRPHRQQAVCAARSPIILFAAQFNAQNPTIVSYLSQYFVGQSQSVVGCSHDGVGQSQSVVGSCYDGVGQSHNGIACSHDGVVCSQNIVGHSQHDVACSNDDVVRSQSFVGSFSIHSQQNSFNCGLGVARYICMYERHGCQQTPRPCSPHHHLQHQPFQLPDCRIQGLFTGADNRIA